MGCAANLAEMYAFADEIDRREGLLAYERYHRVMSDIAAAYSVPLARVIAVFVSLSPNSDYLGNLRSTLSVLQGLRDGTPVQHITVSTYKHCRDRAYLYATGEAEFVTRTRGLKVLSFYRNVLDPHDPEPVTVDGHVCAAWRGERLTMKEAIIRTRREYLTIRDAVAELAAAAGILPNQYQATLWFARKRRYRVKYQQQLNLFSAPDDAWGTLQDVTALRPYPPRTGEPA